MDSLDALGTLDMIARNAEEKNPPEDGDYRDEEGFLMCGKCNTRREMELDYPFGPGGETVRRKVRVQCECRKRAEEEREALEKQRLEKEQEMRAIASLKQQSLMGERLSRATFSSFEVMEKNSKILKLCMSYAERFDEMMAKNQGLLFYGNVSTGKTFAAACIANYLLDRQTSVVMTSFVKLLDSMDGLRQDAGKIILSMNKAKLLIIDDLGAERDTSYAAEKIYDFLDSRYNSMLPVILTTNLSLDEMKKETDTRYARIYERIFEMCYPVRFAGISWRRAEASRRFREMESFLEGNDE